MTCTSYDLYATDEAELRKGIWQWQADNGGPGIGAQTSHCEITDKLCHALDKPTLKEACVIWFARPYRRAPYTGLLVVDESQLKVAAVKIGMITDDSLEGRKARARIRLKALKALRNVT